MPEMGGKALIQEMKRTAPHLKALGLTGYVVEKVSEDLRAEGFLDVIYKPFEIETLAQAVRDALERDTH
jgi:DNA-binding NtrC family response regulator